MRCERQIGLAAESRSEDDFPLPVLLDESVQFILPLLHILKVVDTQPKTVEELKAALTPMSEIVAQRIDRLMSIVQQCSRAQATDKNM